MADHPVKVPPELAQDWLLEAHHKDAPPGTCPNARILMDRAAQWGADQELEACCKWLQCEAGDSATEFVAGDLRAARRPKPPTLAEQALKAAYVELVAEGKHGSLIISALNRLAELEAQQ